MSSWLKRPFSVFVHWRIQVSSSYLRELCKFFPNSHLEYCASCFNSMTFTFTDLWLLPCVPDFTVGWVNPILSKPIYKQIDILIRLVLLMTITTIGTLTHCQECIDYPMIAPVFTLKTALNAYNCSWTETLQRKRALWNTNYSIETCSVHLSLELFTISGLRQQYILSTKCTRILYLTEYLVLCKSTVLKMIYSMQKRGMCYYCINRFLLLMHLYVRSILLVWLSQIEAKQRRRYFYQSW